MVKKWILLLALVCTSSQAETIQVEYSRFYSHIKKLDHEDTQALQFAFGFLRVGEGRLCNITSANIITDKQVIPVEVSLENRFTLPSEKALKLADANVEVTFEERANVCDMSVQLETKPEYLKTQYSRDDLLFLLEQYRAFFNAMGSFLSFMMPSVEGLVVQFRDDNISMPAGKERPAITMGMTVLTESWIDEHQLLSLPEAPLRVTAKAIK